jgi:hypothetical protein
MGILPVINSKLMFRMSSQVYFVLYILIFLPIHSYAQKAAANTNLKKDSSKNSDKNISIYVKDGYSIGIDKGDLGEIAENAGVLFFDKTCLIIGLDDRPYSLVASSEFDPFKLPVNLQDKFYMVKAVTLRLPFVSDEQQVVDFHPMPSWLKKVVALSYLTIDHIKLDPSFFSENLPIKHLVLGEILQEDKNVIIRNIASLKNLKYLVHRSLFTDGEVLTIKERASGVIVLLESEYEKKIENGEINVSK